MGAKGKGFSKTPSSQPKKTKSKKRQSYLMAHFGRDGVLRILEIKALSRLEAFRKFDFFLKALEFCLSEASDDEILNFLEESSLDDGVEL